MADGWPKIRSRRTTTVSPWMNIIAREVEFSPDSEPQIYHAVGQMDYLAVVALTPDGRIPIVHQYRPAIEAFTWELPAGLVEYGEDPAEAASRRVASGPGALISDASAIASHPGGDPNHHIRFRSARQPFHGHDEIAEIADHPRNQFER